MSMSCTDHEKRCRRASCNAKIQDNYAEMMHSYKVKLTGIIVTVTWD